MKKLISMFALIAVLLIGCQSYGPTGTAVVGIGDPSVDLQGVTAIDVVVDQASIKQDNGNWIEILMLPKTLELLELKQSGDFISLGIQSVPDGNYTQLRLHINSMTLTDQSGVHNVKLPSNMIQIKSGLEIMNGTTSVALFDFDAADSLHKTGKGQYIFAPVLHLMISNGADVDKASLDKGKIFMNSGWLSWQNFGMDSDGTIKDNFKLTGDVSIDATSGKITKGGY